ncbi:cystin-1 isoform X2 [Hippopotamus amphibius kiboko]|uniref:cystin-1 isoform X2 n=1 Tax=Hippopotamus amphibius kiboko TaxID=575201 RepID=UPI002598B248|nr:cystin-1 isoform X2 [Hippopotamus amphibius kiboko]
MGSGSSRSGRALRRLRGPDSRPAGPGGAAPEGGTGPGSAAAPEAAREAVAAEGAAGRDPGPAAPPDGGDETLRLLDQLLAESAAWGPGELAPRGPTRPRPAAGAGSRPVFRKTSRGRRAGDEKRQCGKQGIQVEDSAEIQVSPKQSAEDHPESSHGSEAPGSCHKRPERQSAITYDYSEEELMASIEQEYCC